MVTSQQHRGLACHGAVGGGAPFEGVTLHRGLACHGAAEGGALFMGATPHWWRLKYRNIIKHKKHKSVK